jgi:maleate isomerase
VVRRAPGSGINGGRVPAAPKLAQLRIGMITPSSNIMVEPISAAVAAPFGDELSLHFARIPVTRISLDRPSQQQFDLDAMLSAARLLADARVHAICWNGISAAWKGSASDRWICDAVQRETGIPATSATLAQLEAFRVRGIRRFGLAVPYRDDVRRAIVRVYREEGFECVSSAHLGISVNFEFAEIPSESLRRLVRQADSPDAEAIVVTCTNLATARLVDELEAELAKPVLDSLLLALWHPLRLLGWNKSIPGWGRVLADGFDITERHRS